MVSIRFNLVNDLLACRFPHIFWPRVQKMNALFEQTPAFAQIGWRFCFEDELNFLRDLVDTFASKRHRNPLAGTHRVDRDRKFGNRSVHDRLLEQQRLSARRRFHLAVGPFADEQIGVDRFGDAR